MTAVSTQCHLSIAEAYKLTDVVVYVVVITSPYIQLTMAMVVVYTCLKQLTTNNLLTPGLP